MTRAVRDRILKDVNGDISDHLRNHIHLTNCIHLKNHIHKSSPIMADRTLMRDLVALQRSRSLRDPTASPPSRHSPSAIDVLRRGETDEFINGRRSIGIEQGRMSVSSPLGRHNEDDLVGSRSSGLRERYRQDGHLRTLSDQLNDRVLAESDDAASSHNHGNGKQSQMERIAEEAGINVRHRSSLNRGKRRRFRGARRSRASVAARDADAQNEISVASNSFGHENYDHNVGGVPKNGCGIPWNWSRIHNRGKSFLDLAGRSLSCGLSDPRLRKGGMNPGGMDMADMHVMSSSSSTKTDGGEALPLLLDGSQGSDDRAAWLHDYSGELGIYAGNLLKQETDSDLASEGRSGERRSFVKHRNERHQNLAQRYMPRTFRDLVGQSLVVQALSNAIIKRKIGLLYLFYGPHGTGKTSCARVFARALNCLSLEESKPCGYCNSCKGKARNVTEIGPIGNIDSESILRLLDRITTSSRHQSQFRVFIFDECDSVSPECWSAILKFIDRAPRRIVFILVCSSLDALPHVIITRCQKFFFPKLKDADIIYTLQWIASKEDVEIDKDALKLIASKSDGSLRDAEMTFEQLSLIGKRISVGLVQELVGLVSDEKLVDLLDLALSADTVNTVKNLRDIMESGVEPLALMSQLATVITDILAGSYDFMKERSRRKFFRRRELSKEHMEKLRQALKTLSEAEKQLRVSNDKITWLTAALLQLAPDQHYMLPSSSEDTSSNHSPLAINTGSIRQKPRKSNAEMPNLQAGSSGNVHYNGGGTSSQLLQITPNDKNQMNKDRLQSIPLEEIWLAVLRKIPINSIREFMYQEGKLISINYGAAPTVQLQFNSQLTKSKAEKFSLHILQAFETVLKSPVTIEIRCESKKGFGVGPILLPAAQYPSTSDPTRNRDDINRIQIRDASSSGINKREIVEIEASPQEFKVKHKDDKVIQNAEGSSQHSGWSRRKAVSIAEKLEQENLRLEPSSRRLLCWNPPKGTRRKLSRLKIRARRPQTLLKFVSCGRCLSSRSPRSR